MEGRLLYQCLYSKETKCISVKFYADPCVPGSWPRAETEWKDTEFVIQHNVLRKSPSRSSTSFRDGPRTEGFLRHCGRITLINGMQTISTRWASKQSHSSLTQGRDIRPGLCGTWKKSEILHNTYYHHHALGQRIPHNAARLS